MPNKAELETELANVKADLETFRKTVVEVAQTEGRRRGWCSELERVLAKRLGLGDLLPHTFIIQEKTYSGGHWHHYTDVKSFESGEKRARSERNGVISNAKWRLNYDWKRRTETGIERLQVSALTPDTVDTVIEQARAYKNKVAAAKVSKPKFVAPDYPIYRVVERDGNGRQVRVSA